MNIQMLVSIVKMRKAYSELIAAIRKEGEGYDLYKQIQYEGTLGTDKEGTFESPQHVTKESREEAKNVIFNLLYLGIGKGEQSQMKDITDTITPTVIEIVDELLVDMYAIFRIGNIYIEDVSFGALIDILPNRIRELLRVELDENQEALLHSSYAVRDMREYLYRVVLERPLQFQMFCKIFWQELGNTKHTEVN